MVLITVEIGILTQKFNESEELIFHVLRELGIHEEQMDHCHVFPALKNCEDCEMSQIITREEENKYAIFWDLLRERRL